MKTYIFGHKNPDTDSTMSAINMANLESKLGKEVEPLVLGELNKETQYILNYFKVAAPRQVDSVEEGSHVILVDHNEFTQSIDGIENLKITKVVDHHRIQNFATAEPLYYRSEPVGCSNTIIYKLYKEAGVEVDALHAGLMLSAIISDTLLFKSPTCTEEDYKIANELAKIAGINVNEYGLKMLKAGTDLSDYNAAQLISIDSKVFEMNNFKVEIAQINTVSIPDLMNRAQEIKGVMKEKIEQKGLDLFMIAITDILEGNSQVLALGNRQDLIEDAFKVKLVEDSAFVPGLVSRKKQIVPVLTDAANK